MPSSPHQSASEEVLDPRTYDEALRALREASERRREALEAITEEFDATIDEEAESLRGELSRLERERAAVLEEAENEYRTVRAEAAEAFEQRGAELEAALRQERGEVVSACDRELAALDRKFDDSRWVVDSMLDDSSDQHPKRKLERFQEMISRSWTQQEEQLKGISKRIVDQFSELRMSPGEVAPSEFEFKNAEAAADVFQSQVSEMEGDLDELGRLKLARLFVGMRSIWLLLFVTVLLAVPIAMFVRPSWIGFELAPGDPAWYVVAAGGAFVLSGIFLLVLYTIASMTLGGMKWRIEQAYADAKAAQQAWQRISQRKLEARQAGWERDQETVEADRASRLERIRAAREEAAAEIQARRSCRVTEIERSYGEQIQQNEAQQAKQLAQVDQEYERRRAALSSEFEQRQRDLESRLAEHEALRSVRRNQLIEAAEADWRDAVVRWESTVSLAKKACEPDVDLWEEVLSDHWEPPASIPSAIRIGEYDVDVAGMLDGEGEGLRDPHVLLPAALPFPSRPSLVLEGPGAQSRQAAVQMLQVALLRLLTLIPPGKLRLTIIDPVGLGESFAGLMHLADFDELLVTSRIWTETQQIDARLADLTAHMENVLQKYLRNEFPTIEDYNRRAGEVAEPYHILVVADFPARFSEAAVRRLVSIANSGPRCGVYLLSSIDTTLPLPNRFDLDELRRQAVTFEWKKEAFRSRQKHLGAFPLEIDPVPPSDHFTTIVKQVGEASKDTRRVEVAFTRIAPPADEVWTKDSRDGISVPLGRAGAMKLQSLSLGKGTAQHVLIAGKTGSGKSTLLHALITNLALHYSVDDVEFYLIDFKKGVEFKAYAGGTMPHARVIAIESDREFGVSVLRRLDEELKRRGELFREEGTQDIAGFRNQRPDVRMPRILLVIDEFQEFFVEDDQLSGTAALLLDRLIRQGRAFGMHVVLGSQTLAGAYTLARSTLGQIGVRIALQCSEADAHLILNENNTAARLLTRPGEAIYNDAGGMPEGNSPFQIAWLPDSQREEILRNLGRRADAEQVSVPSPIVFEGHKPADPLRNRDLVASVRRRGGRRAGQGVQLWLGDAVEIKPPTSVTLSRQTAANLLIVGQGAAGVGGLLSISAISFAVSAFGASTAGARQPLVAVIDGTAAENSRPGFWKRLRDVLPKGTTEYADAEMKPLLQRWLDDLHERQAGPSDRPDRLLIIDHIAGLRSLRKSEEEFTFSAFGKSSEGPKEVSPAEMFAELVKDGPEVGLHVVVWCDSPANLERWLGRTLTREFGYRVAFQMNANDSSQLIESPAASRLGPHRAILYREGEGVTEKFRPYGLPSQEWLEVIREAGGSGEEVGDDLEVVTDLDAFRIL